ncbi:hypothetical protein BABINDRAFT_182482, partial [Babjeviella inositovora NRRL Y-12698]
MSSNFITLLVAAFTLSSVSAVPYWFFYGNVQFTYEQCVPQLSTSSFTTTSLEYLANNGCNTHYIPTTTCVQKNVCTTTSTSTYAPVTSGTDKSCNLCMVPLTYTTNVLQCPLLLGWLYGCDTYTLTGTSYNIGECTSTGGIAPTYTSSTAAPTVICTTTVKTVSTSTSSLLYYNLGLNCKTVWNPCQHSTTVTVCNTVTPTAVTRYTTISGTWTGASSRTTTLPFLPGATVVTVEVDGPAPNPTTKTVTVTGTWTGALTETHTIPFISGATVVTVEVDVPTLSAKPITTCITTVQVISTSTSSLQYDKNGANCKTVWNPCQHSSTVTICNTVTPTVATTCITTVQVISTSTSSLQYDKNGANCKT